MDFSMAGFPVLHYLPEFAQIYVHWIDDAIQPSHSLLPSSLPALNISQHQRLFQCISSSRQGTNGLEHQLQHQSFQYPGLIYFRIDWFDLLAVQGTLKSLQHHNLKASILQCSAFFMVQLSHPYMTTGKTIALTTQTFIGKVMSLLLNMLSKFVIAFLPRSKHLLISLEFKEGNISHSHMKKNEIPFTWSWCLCPFPQLPESAPSLTASNGGMFPWSFLDWSALQSKNAKARSSLMQK